ncbi:hypothetical protein [Actinoallomurus iriomotensis]|uniref:Uncharacterized protein n=1 Tax=Actinoallomurus iriomotensis TaxID=478107 RepID=A0A9W6VX57_9ACTN|nr:hypothetical protein [Actinoallomurus iriomotensis]GLY82297.1 hypothetical protein Airi02_002290 [Actinoallomurus iriomotensis]
MAGIDDTSGNSDEPDEPEQGSDQAGRPERPMPPDRPGEPGYPSRADARRAAIEANQEPADVNDESGGSRDGPKPVRETPPQGELDAWDRDEASQEYRKESDVPSAMSDTDDGRADEQKPADTYVSPMERMPSHSNFANLDEEVAARSTSRENVRRDNAANEKNSESGTKPDRKATKPFWMMLTS